MSDFRRAPSPKRRRSRSRSRERDRRERRPRDRERSRSRSRSRSPRRRDGRRTQDRGFDKVLRNGRDGGGDRNWRPTDRRLDNAEISTENRIGVIEQRFSSGGIINPAQPYYAQDPNQPQYAPNPTQSYPGPEHADYHQELGQAYYPPQHSQDANYIPAQDSSFGRYGDYNGQDRYNPMDADYGGYNRIDSYEASLEAGLDGHLTPPPSAEPLNYAFGEPSRSFARREQPSATLYIKDFATVEDAARLMESEARYSTTVDGSRVHLEYSHAPIPAGAVLAASQPFGAMAGTLDWVCDMCGAVNFARRPACYQCSSVRPKNPQRVTADSEGPSPVLKVSNLERHISEDDLQRLCAAHAPVREVRLVMDKFTGAPRGFAFVQFFSVGDATRALQALQNVPLDLQQTPIRLCYAKERAGDRAALMSASANLAADALQAGQSMQQYSAWAPREFDEAAIQPPPAETDAGAGGRGDAMQGSGAGGSGGEQPQAGFAYDPTSGYWYDAASGYYYDANTGLYYHQAANSWFSYDAESGQYTPVAADQQQQQQTSSSSTAAQAAIAASEAAVSAAATTSSQQLQERKKGAIIGAAPQLNPEGLLAAARALQDKEKELARAKAAALAKAKQKVATVASVRSTKAAAATTSAAAAKQPPAGAAPSPAAAPARPNASSAAHAMPPPDVSMPPPGKSSMPPPSGAWAGAVPPPNVSMPPPGQSSMPPPSGGWAGAVPPPDVSMPPPGKSSMPPPSGAVAGAMLPPSAAAVPTPPAGQSATKAGVSGVIHRGKWTPQSVKPS